LIDKTYIEEHLLRTVSARATDTILVGAVGDWKYGSDVIVTFHILPSHTHTHTYTSVY